MDSLAVGEVLGCEDDGGFVDDLKTEGARGFGSDEGAEDASVRTKAACQADELVAPFTGAFDVDLTGLGCARHE